MKLYTTYPSHFVGYTARITAEICNYPVENIFCPPGCELEQDKEFIAKLAHHNFPMAELPDGKVFS